MEAKSVSTTVSSSIPTIAINPAASIVNYLQSKLQMQQPPQQLAPDQIEKKLLNGEIFDMIKGEGSDIDTKLMEEILN